jgi:hypothetical protein
MFDPDRRYQSAGELLSDLIVARYNTHSQSERKRAAFPWSSRILAGLIAVNLVLTGGILYNLLHKDAAVIPRESESGVVSEDTSNVEDVSRESKAGVVSEDTGHVEGVSRENENNTESTGYITSEADGSPTASAVYTFKEPLIEEAVRQILHKENEPVTEDDLTRITQLHIMGQQVYRLSES